jgi:transcriptional regulator with XRE-family HTH domain
MGQIDKNLKNGLFKVAIDYIYKNHLVNSQGEIAEKIGISTSALSRIMNDKKFVGDDTLRKMNEAFGDIFNMAYFRGESPIMLVADIMPEQKTQQNPISNDHFDLVKAALEAKDETIAALREQIETKDELIAALRQQIQTLQQQEYLKDFPVGTVEGIEKQDQVRV